MAQLREFFQKYARNRGIAMAEALAKEMKIVVGVQAPTRRTRSGRIVAATPATPFAPPRRVTGKLQASIKVVRVKNGAKVVVYQPYGLPLETSTRWWGWPHIFVARAKHILGIRGGTY